MTEVVKLKGLSWSLTPEEIAMKTDELIANTKKTVDVIAQVDLKEVTCENVMKPLADLETEFTISRNGLDFFQHIHPDKARRDASTESDKKLSAFEVQMSMRRDVYERIDSLNTCCSIQNAEGKRYLERKIKNGKRNGIHLDESIRKQIEVLKKKESELGISFQKNLTEADTILYFTKDQLAGLSDEFVESLNKSEDGKYEVTLKYPHVFPLMKKCSVAKTREETNRAFNSRCKETNSKILEELVDLRREKAALLGFENHASFIHAMRMAENPKKVKEFLVSLAEKLKPLGKSDMDLMLELKKEECERNKEEFDGKINMCSPP